MSTPRTLLYIMPFFGLTLLSVDMTSLLEIPDILVWGVLMLPGPLYVHITWAPRWRMLCMLEDGSDPYSGNALPSEIDDEITDSNGNDTEILEVVEELSEE